MKLIREREIWTHKQAGREGGVEEGGEESRKEIDGEDFS